jgi:hypothetical protein
MSSLQVLFYGTLTPRRAALLGALRAALAPRGFLVAHVSTGLDAGFFGGSARDTGPTTTLQQTVTSAHLLQKG